MFSFFKRNKVKVHYTHQGSHGKHWYSIFTMEDSPELFMKHITDSLETGVHKKIGANTIIIDGPLTRSIVHKNSLESGFPCWKGTKYEQYTTASVTEWTHSHALEAVIRVGDKDKRALTFFATDYAINKERYKNEENITANIVGCAYSINTFNPELMTLENGLQLSEDFCGYFPGDDADEIIFIGKVQNINAHQLGTITGFIVTINITSENSLDIFVAQSKMTDDIEINKTVMGTAWLLGCLE